MAVPRSYEGVAWNPVPDSENRIHSDEGARQYGFRGGLVPGVTVSAYLIHPAWVGFEPWGFPIHLSEAQRQTKLRAVLCHETQTSLSRGRFSSYAQPEELFTAEPW